MRPPRIRTDIAAPPLIVPGTASPRRQARLAFLLSARLERDADRLVALAVHVHTLDVVLQVLERGLRERWIVRGGRLRLLDHLVLQCDSGGPLERRGVHDPYASGVRPDQLVD